MSEQLRRITYVEDEPDIRQIAQMVLEEIGGFTLNVCENGHQAIETVTLFKPDLILLDVMMPGMDGVQAFHFFRTMPQTAATPIVFMTAKAQKHEVEHYRALGAADVIVKPFNALALPDYIRAIWDRVRAREMAH